MYAGEIVEKASADRLFAAPQHPYTVGLLGSLPSVGARRRRLATIAGSVPRLDAAFTGCRFAGRCPFAQPRCTTAPPLNRLGADHVARCHRSDEMAVLRPDARLAETWERGAPVPDTIDTGSIEGI